ncbi:glycosyltransferase [Eubacterium callanderi]|uniref:Glycosyltransferase n=1 Tax=Eubacterium callanderi TaxID=53442 RepID=A0A853JTK2_9FIRM|nr:glycosyltransferase [Eubacterium callanderi]
MLSELRIDYQNKFVISSVARYHPVKDIPNFIEAISVVKKKYPNTIALLCGKGEDITNNELIKVIDGFHLELNKDIFLLGERNDLPMVYSASDLFILHSVSEASPNCLLEAMSCRTLCLATDVGNVRDLIEDKDLIVPPKEPMELATKIIKAIELSDKEKNRIKEANRIKIKQKYSIEKCVEIYEMFYEKNY